MFRTIKILSTKRLRQDVFSLPPYSGVILEECSFVQIDFNENIILPPAQKVNAIVTSANAIKALKSTSGQLPAFDTVYCIAGRQKPW